jgi:Fe-S-cluster-containing hydrogenase component 2
MDICPTKNIQKNKRGHPRWGRDCLGCFYCEMRCPEDAITSAFSRPIFRMLPRPFLRYNVRHWAQEAEHDYVHVVHKHGQIERMSSTSADDTQL